MTVRTSRLLLDDRHWESSRRFQTTMTQDAYGTKVPDRVISVEMAEQSTAAFTGGMMTSGARARDEAVRSGRRIAEAGNRKQREASAVRFLLDHGERLPCWTGSISASWGPC